jgi:signal transduction histidine kinase
LLGDLAALVEPRLDEIAEQFYSHLTGFAATRRVFRDEAMVARLKSAQKAYLLQALRGPYDEAYFQTRWRIGYIHNVIHVAPEWFIGAIQLYHRILFPLLLERYAGEPQALIDHALALDKVMNLDMQVALESYWSHYTSTMGQLQSLNRRLESVADAKDQLLANMSHEFRTPLNVIIGFTELMQDDTDRQLGPEHQEYLGEIHRAGKALLRLTEDLLDLSKYESGRLELFFRSFSIGSLLREKVASARPQAEGRGLSLAAEIPADLGVMRADPLRVRQILDTLLDNALKFTERGGVSIRAAREGEMLHLEVRDTGPGIAPEETGRIFEEFARVEDAHTSRSGGVGLGLSLARRLVQSHQGQIWVESEVGHGSSFHVMLPYAPTQQPYHKGTAVEP